MSSGSELVVVLVTVPDAATGEALGSRVVEERLAACVNRLPGVRSVFHWQGALDSAEEELLIFKAPRSRFEALARRIEELHPYDVPEILALPVVAAHAGYAQWVHEEARG